MAKKKQPNKKGEKPEKVIPPVETEKVEPEKDPLEPTLEDSHVPGGIAPAQVEPKKDPVEQPKPVENKVRRTDTTDELLIGHGGPEHEEAVPIPTIIIAPPLPAEKMGDTGYSTEVIEGAGNVNLDWHPTIVCGRCEICGSTRYVGGEVWKVINKKTGDITYRYRGGKWVEIDAAHCKHYRQVHIACSYCRESFTGMKDGLGQFMEVLGDRNVFVVSRPDAPSRLIMVCSDFRCKVKFDTQFHINRTL